VATLLIRGHDTDIVITCERRSVERETKTGETVMEKLTVGGKTFTDCKRVGEVIGSVKAPNGTVGDILLVTFEILNVSGEVNEWAVQFSGFGMVKVMTFKTAEAAKSFVDAQSKFFIQG
jgi:hypothetical protein